MDSKYEPSLTTVWLFFTALTLLYFVLLVQPMGDPDTWIHLRNGKYMLEHGITGYLEPFSFTIPKEKWESVEWLFQITMYALYKIGGVNLIIAVKSIVLALNICILSVIAWRRNRNLLVLIITLIFTSLAFNTKFYPERPQLITQLFLTILLWALIRYTQQPVKSHRERPEYFWLAPIFFALWANIHPGVIIGFGVWGLFIIMEAVKLYKRDAFAGREAWTPIRTLIFFFILSALGACCNPLGPKIFLYPFGILKWPIFRQNIIEWQSSQYRLVPVFFWYLAASWLVIFLNRKRCRLWEIVLSGTFSWLALSSYRHIFLFLIINFLALLLTEWVNFRGFCS